jgi:hypothetical protein
MISDPMRNPPTDSRLMGIGGLVVRGLQTSGCLWRFRGLPPHPGQAAPLGGEVRSLGWKQWVLNPLAGPEPSNDARASSHTQRSKKTGDPSWAQISSCISRVLIDEAKWTPRQNRGESTDGSVPIPRSQAGNGLCLKCIPILGEGGPGSWSRHETADKGIQRTRLCSHTRLASRRVAVAGRSRHRCSVASEPHSGTAHTRRWGHSRVR